MVTKEQFIKGIINYVDSEVIPALPTMGKWGIGTLIILATGKLTEITNGIVQNPLIKTLGVTDENGNIDSDAFLNALSQAATKYGKLDIDIPVVGILTFSDKDIEKLRTYMIGGSYGRAGM